MGEKKDNYLSYNNDVLKSVILSLEPEHFFDFEKYWDIYKESSFIRLYQDLWKERLNFDKLPILDKIYYAAVFRDRPLLNSLLAKYEEDNEAELQYYAVHELLPKHQEKAYGGAAASGWDEYIDSEYESKALDEKGEIVKPVVLFSIMYGKGKYIDLLDDVTDEDLHIEAILETISNSNYRLFIQLLDKYDNRDYNRYKLAINMLKAERFEDFTFTEDEIEDYVQTETAAAREFNRKNQERKTKNQMDILQTVMEYAIDNSVYFTDPTKISKERYFNSADVELDVPYTL